MTTTVALLAVLLGLALGQPDCSKPFLIHDTATQTTYAYDLSLAKSANAQQLLSGSESGADWAMYLNICGDATSLIGGGLTCTKPTAVCQVDKTNTKAYDCGGSGTNNANWNVAAYHEPGSTTPLFDKGVVVTAGGGDTCTGGITRVTTLYLKCDPTVTKLPTIGQGSCPGSPACLAILEPKSCEYVLNPISYCGFCPLGTGCTGGGGPSTFDMGWVFVIIVLCGLFIYFIGGILLLKFALHKDGREIVPQVDFWTALPGLVVDGIKFAWRKITCQTGGYTEV